MKGLACWSLCFSFLLVASNALCCECRKAELERIQSYQQDLQEMKQRVKERPLLFEQAAQVTVHDST